MKAWFVFLISVMSLNAMANGYLRIQGVKGANQPTDRVKAVRCDFESRKLKKLSCKEKFIFSLNQDQALPAGQYLIGYSNSQYPGFIKIEEGQRQILNLHRVQIESEFSKNTLVIRDFSQAIEQKKLMLSFYGLGKSFFEQQNNEGGYFSLRVNTNQNVLLGVDYNHCVGIASKDKDYKFQVERKASVGYCQIFNKAQSYSALASLFQFEKKKSGTLIRQNTNNSQSSWIYPTGDFTQSVVLSNYDPMSFMHQKHAVAYATSGGTFVDVFSGSYKVIDLENPNRTKSVQIDSSSEENFGDEVEVKILP